MHTVDKPISEKTKAEIEKKLEGMGDYVKMSYLQRALNSGLNFDTKKFVLLRLAGIYEARRMFLESAKMIKAASEINTTFKNKIKDYMRAVELYIKGGDYVEADRIFAQSLALGNDKEKKELKTNFKDYYLTQGKFYLGNDKRNYARIAFEKVLSLDLSTEDRKGVQEMLLELYNKLGLVKEYYALKKGM